MLAPNPKDRMRNILKSCVLAGLLVFAAGVFSPARAAITFVATSSSAPNATSSTFVLTAPAGIAAGDMLIAQIAAIGGSGVTLTAPAGWTLIIRTNSATALLQAVYYKFAGAADVGASYTWTLSSSQKSTGGIAAYRGVNPYEPLNAFAGQANASSSSITTPSVTTTASNAMLVGFFGLGTAQAVFTPPAGMTERYDVSSNALPGTASSVADVILATPGASGSKVATADKSSVSIGQLIALRPTASLLADYHFDECFYTGVGAEVIDSTGSYNATAKNSLNTATPGVVQRYGNFNSYATYAQTSIPIPGEWSLGVWFKLPMLSTQQYHVIASVAGGSDLLYLDASDGLRWGVYTLTATTAGTFKFSTLSNAWHYMTVVGRGSDTLLYIDGTLVDTITGNKTKGTLTYLGTSYDNVNTAAAQGFGAPLDEMQVYLNPLTPTEINTIYTNQLAGNNADGSTRAATGCINHFAISNNGSGVNCQAEPVTITAHDVSHNPIVANGTVVGITTSTGHGDWTVQSGSGTLVNSGNGVATYTFGNETNAVLLLKDTFAETLSINLNAGGITEAASEDPSLTFAPSGFRFIDAAYTAIIANQVAGVTSGNYYLQAIRTDTNTGACVGVFNNQTVNIELASQCVNPTTCAGKQVSFNGTNITSNPNSGVTTYTTLPVTFLSDSTSRALFTFVYPDVGQIKLYARYNIPRPNGVPSGNYMSGSSNAFTARPYAFTISNVVRTSDAFANPGAASASGPVFITAGDAFTATVTATAFGGAATPNFGKETTPEGVLLTPNLVLPAGGNNPSVGNGTIAGGAFSSGAATVSNLNWGEVGIITLTPSVADGDYLGAGNVSVTISANIGRFYPHHFVLNGGIFKARSDLTCAPASTFTYMGEPFSLTFTLFAQNISNALTQNYAGSFARLDGNTAAKWTAFGVNDSLGLGATDGSVALSSRLSVSGTHSGSWLNGVGTLIANVALNRAAAPDGPYNALKIGVAPQDQDGVQLLPAALNLDADLNSVNERKQVATADIRYGRMRLNNAIGSERLSLPVPVKAQYFNGTGFVSNLADSCTVFNLTPKTDNSPSNIQYGSLLIDNPLGAMTVGASDLSATTSLSISSGGAILTLPAPNLSGSIDLTLTVPSWLQYNWTGIAGNPKARATFGAYKNTNQFIYQRENY